MIQHEQTKMFQLGISVNCAVYAYDGESHKVLLIRRKREPFENAWALPGKLIAPNDDLDATVARIIKASTGIKDEDIFYSRQIRAFVDTDRHPFGRVVSIAYICLVRYTEFEPQDSDLFSMPKWFAEDKIPKLVFDHDDIIVSSKRRLVDSLRTKPIVFQLLNKEFSLPELQSVYESILDTELDKRNFRRKLRDMPFIEDTGFLQKVHQYRPARLYKYNHETFRAMKAKGYVFSL